MNKMTNGLILSILFIILSIIDAKSQVEKASPGYYTVLATKLNVRNNSDINATVVSQLNFAALVHLLSRSGKYELVKGTKSGWVYIDSRSYDKNGRDTIKGWVVDYYLSDLSEFKPVKSFGDYYYEVLMTHNYVRRNFYSDGTFTYIHYDKDKGTDVELKGQLYQFRNVIIAQGEWTQLFMYIDEKGNIVTEFNHILQKGHKTFKLNEPAGPDVLRPDMWCTPDKKKKEQ